MKAVMYGGGNIGRGFIGALLSQSGYQVTFIDIAAPVIKALQERNSYPVRYVDSNGYQDVWIRNVTAVDGNDTQAVADAIAECDIMATAVGARVLRSIVPNLISGLRKRWASQKGPLNILICENLMDANAVLEGMLKEHLTKEECALFDQSVGLVEASIGRMVPVQTPEMQDGDPMRVCVERYGYLPVDKAAFKGDIPAIHDLVPDAPFDFYIKRKLYVHNLGHAICAYLGDLQQIQYIWQAIDDPDIRIVVQNAMLESAMALSKKYNIAYESLQMHINNLLWRFTNAALKDTCQRVGNDPGRKLGPEDRLIGAAKLALQQGITPSYIALGAAAGIFRYLKEQNAAQSTRQAALVLKEVSQLDPAAPLAQIILAMHQLICQGATVSQLRRAADDSKGLSCKNVI